MLNHENNYRIRSEFASFLRDFPGLRITDSESDGYVNIVVMKNYPSDSSSYFFRSLFQSLCSSNLFLVHQLLNELEKDFVDVNEIVCIGGIVKEYLHVLKKMAGDRRYYILASGIMMGILPLLLFALVLFPENKALMYGSLITDLYGFGFWLFSVWSSSQYAKTMSTLENKLIEKINFLQSISMPQAADNYPGSSESELPSYEDVIEEMRRNNDPRISIIPNSMNFFVLPAPNNEYHDNNNTDSRALREERAYAI